MISVELDLARLQADLRRDVRDRPELRGLGDLETREHAGIIPSPGQRDTMDAAVIEFTLDGKTVSAPEGELLVHAAARHGVFIPTLCHDDKLDPYGGCRMCLVEVEGAPRPVPACAERVRGAWRSPRTARRAPCAAR